MDKLVHSEADKKRNNTEALAVIIHDVSIAVIALPVAMMLRENDLFDAEQLATAIGWMPLLAASALTAAVALGSYRAVWRYMGIPEIIRLVQFVMLTVLLFSVGQFLIDRLHDIPRSIPPLQFLVAMFLLLASRLGYGVFLRWTETGPAAAAARPILLIGGGDGAALLIRMLGFRRQPTFEPVGILCNQVNVGRSIAGVPILGRLTDLDRVIANLGVQGCAPTQIIITRPHHELGRGSKHGYAAAEELLDRASAAGIAVADLPDFLRFKDDLDGVEPHAADGLAAVYPRLKRLFDILVAATILTAAAPLMALIATAVALFIQRPVLFVQVRPGRGRRPFKLYKFRSMRDPLDGRGRGLSDAERTPLAGRFLRRSRLDELPQFWNVLIGDMAIIGPRPLVAAELDAMPDRGEARCLTKPGITGWAQVNGGHQLDVTEKQALDRWYAAHASATLDLCIVWRTVRMMLFGERREENAIAHALATPTIAVGAAAE